MSDRDEKLCPRCRKRKGDPICMECVKSEVKALKRVANEKAMRDLIKEGDCGHFCEACARRDDLIEQQQSQIDNMNEQAHKTAKMHIKILMEADEEIERLNKVVEAAEAACLKSWVINGGLTVACVDDLKSALAELEPPEATK